MRWMGESRSGEVGNRRVPVMRTTRASVSRSAGVRSSTRTTRADLRDERGPTGARPAHQQDGSRPPRAGSEPWRPSRVPRPQSPTFSSSRSSPRQARCNLRAAQLPADRTRAELLSFATPACTLLCTRRRFSGDRRLDRDGLSVREYVCAVEQSRARGFDSAAPRPARHEP